MIQIPNISFESIQNNSGFELLNLSSLFSRLDTMKDHNPTLPHRIAFFALLLVTKGSGTHQIDLEDYSINEGTVLKLAKGQVHAFQKQPQYEGFLVLFTEEFVFNYFSKSSINIISHLYNYHLSSPKAMDKKGNEALLNQLSLELKSDNIYAQNNIIAAYLDLYLLKLERETSKISSPKSNSKYFDTFIQFKNLVETNYTKTRNVKDYADQMFLSTKTLNQVVKEFTIITAKTFIDNYVSLEVKRDIVSTNKSLKEIAYDIGFDEVTNFTKFFKKNNGVTPKEFREKQSI